jgi:hypothetical protein
MKSGSKRFVLIGGPCRDRTYDQRALFFAVRPTKPPACAEGLVQFAKKVLIC